MFTKGTKPGGVLQIGSPIPIAFIEFGPGRFNVVTSEMILYHEAASTDAVTAKQTMRELDAARRLTKDRKCG